MVAFPRWLYESLPYVYAGAGVAAAFSLDSISGRLSGILLITAAGVVGYQRYEYRRLQRERTERLLWLQEQERKRKLEKQAWLKEQADIYRKKIEQKEQDF